MSASKSRKQHQPTLIRQFRKKKGWTLEQLADRLGMSASAISYLERGQSAYQQETLEAIAGALGTSVASLLGRDPTLDEAMASIWDEASEEEKRQIIEVAKALKRAAS
jgi:transcriptional regulator with XRE-family HTH domain